MKIHLATDHAGFELKEKIKAFLVDLKYDIVDHGAFEFNPDDDYPDFISKAALAVSEDPKNNMGLVFGGSGQGEDMVADKFPHVRSAVYYGGHLSVVQLAREHNDANVLSIGARLVEEDEAKKAVEIFLNTPFSNDERHIRRINKFD